MRIVSDVALYLLIANGLRCTLGIPPVADWLKRRPS